MFRARPAHSPAPPARRRCTPCAIRTPPPRLRRSRRRSSPRCAATWCSRSPPTTGALSDVTLTTNAVDLTTKYGWYVDLPVTGERVVTNPALGQGVARVHHQHSRRHRPVPAGWRQQDLHGQLRDRRIHRDQHLADQRRRRQVAREHTGEPRAADQAARRRATGTWSAWCASPMRRQP